VSDFSVISNREAMAKEFELILGEYLAKVIEAHPKKWGNKNHQRKLISDWVDRLIASGCKSLNEKTIVRGLE
jgi:hypothetical protein